TATRVLAQRSDELVVRHAVEPRRRIVGQPRARPGFERGHQGGLNGVLDRLYVLHAHPARQHGDQPAVLVPEEMLDQASRAQGVWISMTSTPEPGRTSPGHSRATAI